MVDSRSEVRTKGVLQVDVAAQVKLNIEFSGAAAALVGQTLVQPVVDSRSEVRTKGVLQVGEVA